MFCFFILNTPQRKLWPVLSMILIPIYNIRARKDVKLFQLCPNIHWKYPQMGKTYSKTSITLSELSNEDPSLLKLNSHFSRSRDQNSTAYSECAMVFNFVRSPVYTGTCLVFRFFVCLFGFFCGNLIYVTAGGCGGVNCSWADQVESVSSRGRGLINLQLPPH